jgi:hypothetical protein
MEWPQGVGLRLTQGGSGEFGFGTRSGGALALGELFIGPTCARRTGSAQITQTYGTSLIHICLVKSSQITGGNSCDC